MIDINNESDLDVDVEALLRLVQHHLLELHVSPDAELAIVLVDEAAMAELHVQWMDEPGPTDVLSFPMDELRPGTAEQVTPPGLLGDIVVCPQIAETQAENRRALAARRDEAAHDARAAAPARLRPRPAR